AAIPVALIDGQHRCVDASPALGACLGLQRADLVGLPVDDLFGPLNAAVVARHIDAALAGEAQRLRVCYLNAERSERWLQIEITAHVGGEGAMKGCQLFAMDVTPEHQAFIEAQAGERRLRAIMDQIPVTVSYIDADYRYRYINHA